MRPHYGILLRDRKEQTIDVLETAWVNVKNSLLRESFIPKGYPLPKPADMEL